MGEVVARGLVVLGDGDADSDADDDGDDEHGENGEDDALSAAGLALLQLLLLFIEGQVGLGRGHGGEDGGGVIARNGSWPFT